MGSWIQATRVSPSWNAKVKQRIINAVNQALESDKEKVKVLDSTIKHQYLAASALVNDGAETLRGFGQVYTALDV